MNHPLVLVLYACFFIVPPFSAVTGQKQDTPAFGRIPTQQEILGDWKLISYKNPRDSVFSAMKDPDRAIKTITAGRYSFAYFNAVTKRFEMAGGGTYIFRDGNYTETVDYFSLDTGLVGRVLPFTLRIKSDTLYQRRVLRNGTRMEEYWKRLSQ